MSGAVHSGLVGEAIGGFTLAIGLLQDWINVQVYEAAPGLGETGLLRTGGDGSLLSAPRSAAS